MRHRLRMWWWRSRTAARLLRPTVRAHWRERFRAEPQLLSARHWADSNLVHAQLGFETMAGFYNDMTEGGHMSAKQARDIYLMRELPT